MSLVVGEMCFVENKLLLFMIILMFAYLHAEKCGKEK